MEEDDVELFKVGNRLYRRYHDTILPSGRTILKENDEDRTKCGSDMTTTTTTTTFDFQHRRAEEDETVVVGEEGLVTPAQILSASSLAMPAVSNSMTTTTTTTTTMTPPSEKEEISASTVIEEEEQSVQIERDPLDNVYRIRLTVSRENYKHLIGKAGKTHSQLQKETSTEIKIPPIHSKSNEIVIEGQRGEDLLMAKKRIMDIVKSNSSREFLEYTHFLCIPISSHALQQKIADLYLDIRAGVGKTETGGGAASGAFNSNNNNNSTVKSPSANDAPLFDESIFMPPTKLHLTLFMLRSHNDETMNRIQALLNGKVTAKLRELFATDGGDGGISLKSLKVMGDDPKRTRVVYMDVADNTTKQRILQFVAFLNQTFLEEGIAVSRDISDDPKLHMTLMNIKYLKMPKNRSKTHNFDASSVLDRFCDFELGFFAPRTIELCSLSNREGGKRDCYTSVLSIPFL